MMVMAATPSSPIRRIMVRQGGQCGGALANEFASAVEAAFGENIQTQNGLGKVKDTFFVRKDNNSLKGR